MPTMFPSIRRAARVGVVVVATALVAASVASAHKTQTKHLKIVHPHFTEPAAGVSDVNVSMTIHNESREPERLVAAVSSAARETRLVGSSGDGIDIPAGGSVALSPTGAHIRLLGLSKTPVSYDMLPLQLTFAHAGRIKVEVMVEESAAGLGATPAAKPHDARH